MLRIMQNGFRCEAASLDEEALRESVENAVATGRLSEGFTEWCETRQ